jgi:hypothetical protein
VVAVPGKAQAFAVNNRKYIYIIDIYIYTDYIYIYIHVVHHQPMEFASFTSQSHGRRQGQSLGHAVTSRLHAKPFALEASLRPTGTVVAGTRLPKDIHIYIYTI